MMPCTNAPKPMVDNREQIGQGLTISGPNRPSRWQVRRPRARIAHGGVSRMTDGGKFLENFPMLRKVF
jgi:hypothetical protein